MEDVERLLPYLKVALRKESVDRNEAGLLHITKSVVALRKESVDRNLSLDPALAAQDGRSP